MYAALKPRGLYRRKRDIEIYRVLGEFPLLYAVEIAALTNGTYQRTCDRLRKFRKEGRVDKVLTVEEMNAIRPTVPYYWYLKPAVEVLRNAPDAIVWQEKSRVTVDHDRGLTEIHLAIRDFISGWVQQKGEDIKEKVMVAGAPVSFFPDARFEANGTTFYIEYQHSATRSKNGKSDLDEKMERYNALLKDRKDAKVIFVYPERRQVESFLDRVSDQYPYLWCWATDMESFKDKATESIFWCPKDYDERTYAFCDAVA
jgi:hypothetical protein